MKKILQITGVALLLIIGVVSFANAQNSPTYYAVPGDRVGVNLTTLFKDAYELNDNWRSFTQTVKHVGVGKEISIGMVSMYVLDNLDESQSGLYAFTRTNSKGESVTRVVSIIVMERGLKLGIFNGEFQQKEKIMRESRAIKPKKLVMA